MNTAALPEGWGLVELGTLGVFLKGSGIRKDQAQSGEIPAVRYGEIYTDHQEILQAHRSFISEPVSKTARPIRNGDILFAGSGETKEEIGKCTGFFGNHEAFAGGDIIIFRPRGADPMFLAYLLNSRPLAHQKAQRAQGDAVVHIYPDALSALRLPLPPLHEQRAIAAALSDADGVVAGLERLIAKKRLIKQGAMQDLLTARRRLPGFSGNWEAKKLGSVLSVRHGRSQRDVEDHGGEYPILATGGQIGTASRFLYDKPSVLIGRKGTIDAPRFMERPFWSVDTLFYTEIKPDYSPKFIYYAFLQIDWMSYNEASGVPSLNAKTIENIEISFPDLAEQQAIVAVLSDMDAEIQILEARLAKARAIKEGMMQNLLTGRVRLV